MSETEKKTDEFEMFHNLFASRHLGVYSTEVMRKSLRQHVARQVRPKGTIIYDRTMPSDTIIFFLKGTASVEYTPRVNRDTIFLGEVTQGSWISKLSTPLDAPSSEPEDLPCITTGEKLSICVSSKSCAFYTLSWHDFMLHTNVDIQNKFTKRIQTTFQEWNNFLRTHHRHVYTYQRAAMRSSPKSTHITPVKYQKKLQPTIGLSTASKFAQLGGRTSDRKIIDVMFPHRPKTSQHFVVQQPNTADNRNDVCKRRQRSRSRQKQRQRPQSAHIRQAARAHYANRNGMEGGYVHSPLRPTIRPKSASSRSGGRSQRVQTQRLIRQANSVSANQRANIFMDSLIPADRKPNQTCSTVNKGFSYYVTKILNKEPEADRLVERNHTGHVGLTKDGKPDIVSSAEMARTWKTDLATPARVPEFKKINCLHAAEKPKLGNRRGKKPKVYSRPLYKLHEKLEHRKRGLLNINTVLVGRTDRNNALSQDNAILSRVHVDSQIARRAHQMARDRKARDDYIQQQYWNTKNMKSFDDDEDHNTVN